MSIPFDTNEKVCNNRSGIYAIVNVVTKKFYIGSAVKLNNRKNNHLCNLKIRKHKNKYLQSSYNKHGKEIFVFKVLEYVKDKNLLVDIEDIWIKQYKPLGVLYNIREEASSNLGIKLSEETKKKISEVNKGKIISNEVKKKMSEANKGKKYSDATKHKMSLAKKGKPLSNEHKNKISNANLGNTRGITKSVIQFNIVDKTIIKIYKSAAEAQRETGINSIYISGVCLNKRKSAGGYIWQFEKDYLKIS